MKLVIIEKDAQSFVVCDAGTTVEDLKAFIHETIINETETAFNVLRVGITSGTTFSMAMEYQPRQWKTMAPKKPQHEKRPPPAREWWKK